MNDLLDQLEHALGFAEADQGDVGLLGARRLGDLVDVQFERDDHAAAANALHEGLGGQFQSFNFRGDESGRPDRDLIQAIGVEEMSHVN